MGFPPGGVDGWRRMVDQVIYQNIPVDPGGSKF
jgi:hypothetical protein